MIVEAVIILLLGSGAVLVGSVIRVRLLKRTGRLGPTLSDEDVRRIEQDGMFAVEDDEPLDLDEVREAEERFWAESWDEPDEY